MSSVFISAKAWLLSLFYPLQKELKEIFPSWYHIKTYEEVLVFTCGLMTNPRPLIDHVSEMMLERELRNARSQPDMKEIVQLRAMRKSPLLLKIMTSLYSEAGSAIQGEPHHNKFFNFYIHKQDDLCKRPKDVRLIEIPSQMYAFEFLMKPLQGCTISSPVEDLEYCMLHIHSINTQVSNSVLSACQQISDVQPITDLWIFRLNCDGTEPVESFNLSPGAHSIRISSCVLPSMLLDHLMKQLPQCRDLKKLHLKEIKFHDAASKHASQRVDENRNVATSSSGLADWNLGKAISSWGDNPSLKILSLRNCSIPKREFSEILEALSACNCLTHLDLGGNYLGPEGTHLVQIIKNMGQDPPLEGLHLEYCLIPEDVCCALMKEVRACRKLKDLSLTGNTVRKAGKYIVDIITNLRLDSQLESLYLNNCSIPNRIWVDLLKCLSDCSNIVYLDLSGNNFARMRAHLVGMIKKLAVNPHLMGLYLQNCSIPEEASNDVLEALSPCRNLIQLCYGGNIVGEAGSHLEEIIDNALMERIILSDCKIPRQICETLLTSLSRCERLRFVNLAGNDLRGVVSNFLPDDDSASLYLTQLHVGFTGINSDDMSHITKLVQTHRLPELGGAENFNGLWLQGNNLAKIENQLEALLEACSKEYKREFNIGLWDNQLCDSFEKQWKERCAASNMKLLFKQPADFNDDYFMPPIYVSWTVVGTISRRCVKSSF